MEAYIEVWGQQGPELVPLEAGRSTLGRGASSTVPVGHDPTVSELHAMIERFPTAWVLRDLGSRNGTFVNGDLLVGDRRLHHGDEIRLGSTRLVFRSRETSALTVTAAAEAPPDLTRRERDVLVALCRPLLAGDVFTEPATVGEMAADLVVSEAAVKFHLANLYDKFGVHDGDARRSRLANEAIRRRAITLGDLRGHPG